MKRRAFLAQTFASSAGFIIFPRIGMDAGIGMGFGGMGGGWAAGALDPVSFAAPPPAARPYTYWMWMNGNITKEGITLDLETMHRGGIGGAYMYNNAVGIPRGPVDYNSDSWKNIVLHAVREADRLGIVLSMHNSPGYSGTGGRWIPVDLSMRELVWTETVVSGGNDPGRPAVMLPRPYAKLKSYTDAAILAYPSLPGEDRPMSGLLSKVWADGKEIDKEQITGIDLEKRIRIEPAGAGQSAVLLLQLSQPFTARAITLYRHPETPKDLYDGPRDYPPTFRLESSDDGTTFHPVCALHCPALRAMDAPAAASFGPATGLWFRLVTDSPTYISRVELHAGPRLRDWPAKINYSGGNTSAVLNNDGYTAELKIDPASVIDLTNKMDEEGRLQWTPPAGNWTILRVGHTTTGEVTGAAPEAAIGLECDKFSKSAVDFHFSAFLDPLLHHLEPFVGKSLKSILIDSWEAGKQNWSVQLPEEFVRRRGYDLHTLMPALTGRIVGSLAATENFLRDFRQTHADLVAENYYGHFAELCHQRGLELHGEPYGDGTFDSLQSGAYLDQPMGEFWTRYIYGDAMTSRQAVSLAHANGRPIAASEAFTGMPVTSRWTEYPYSLKAEADWFYTIGLNRLVFHTFVHQPHKGGLPGMTMGPFGTHFDRNSTWAPSLSCWTLYLSRVQYLLQLPGRAVVDICYLTSGEPVSGIPDRSRILPVIPMGYALDVVAAQTLLKKVRIDEGRIVLPDGMSYHVLMVASLHHLAQELQDRIRQWVSQGMLLITADLPDTGSDVRSFDAIAADLKMTPDFTYTSVRTGAAIHFVHRQIGDTDVYFVTNHLRRSEEVVASFRMAGRQPEIWDAESGEIYNAAIYDMQDGRTLLPLEFSPAGSYFVVFRKEAKGGAYKSLIREQANTSSFAPVNVMAKPGTFIPEAAYADCSNNFSLLIWIKPDTYAHRGKGFLIHAPEGEVLYGMGHVAMGLAAGQNAVRIYERGRGQAREVLAVDVKLEGWTAIAVVYRQGSPSLYIDGRLVKEGTASGHIVHPGLGAVPGEDQFQSYFEGNSADPKLHREALEADAIGRLFAMGLPLPEGPSPISVRQDAAGEITALVWEKGKYVLQSEWEESREKGSEKGPANSAAKRPANGAGQRTLTVERGCDTIFVDGPWDLTFQEGRGAPSSLQLPKLISLHLHPDAGVRYFSGTVIYRKTMNLSATGRKAATNQRIFLDLGRVEVLAEVWINSHLMGTVWKEPYRIEITTAIKPGPVHIEVRVTTLWPNRLIGDEELPPENEYSSFGPIQSLPEWYVTDKPKPGQRTTFCVWHSYKAGDPLLAGGLLGPVTLRTAVERKF